MDKVSGKLTVYFEEPFWVGVFEHIENGKLTVAKVTFGAEPKDYEIQEYIQRYYFSLKFSPAVDTVVKDIKRNPKRIQRETKKQMQEIGIGTQSQQALKLQQEQNVVIYFYVIKFCHLNNCVAEHTCFCTILRIREQPVLTAYCVIRNFTCFQLPENSSN